MKRTPDQVGRQAHIRHRRAASPPGRVHGGGKVSCAGIVTGLMIFAAVVIGGAQLWMLITFGH